MAFPKHPWAFKPRFRSRAFGWRSQPAIQRIKEAVSEIAKMNRTDPVLAADGAVCFLERVSAAIQNVDGSSGTISTAVNNAIDQLVPIIANAPADARTRRDWLERLFEALQNDEIPYLETLGDSWGYLCGSPEIASAWADTLIHGVRLVWTAEPRYTGIFQGTTACLSALFTAGRHDELLALLRLERHSLWPYQRWAVRALVAQGRTDDALAMAESLRGPYTNEIALSRYCEQILLDRGDVEDAYQRYGFMANRATTNLATFRNVVRKYPHKTPREILLDLARTTPGEEGKWFAAAKDAHLYDVALTLAEQSPPDPKVLARAARDFAHSQPPFALASGLLALRWIALGHGYEIDASHVRMAYDGAAAAAAGLGSEAEFLRAVEEIAHPIDGPASYVATVLDHDRKFGLR